MFVVFGLIACVDGGSEQTAVVVHDPQAVTYQILNLRKKNLVLTGESSRVKGARATPDDWQLDTTRRLTSHFTYMITTYPHIYEGNRRTCRNLLLSQWGCLGLFSDFGRKKDIDFSFAGAIYNARIMRTKLRTGFVCGRNRGGD